MTEQELHKVLEKHHAKDEYIVMNRKGPYDDEPVPMIVTWNGVDIAELFEIQEAVNHGTMKEPKKLPTGLRRYAGKLEVTYGTFNCPSPEQLEKWAAKLTGE